MVTAVSRGGRLRCFLSALTQRAASTKSAVESEPPETARRSAGTRSRPLNSALASSSRTASSAMATLLFPLHGLLHACRRVRIFAQHFAERGAGRFLFAQGRQRLPEPQQRLRRARTGFIFGGHGKKGFGGVPILLPLEQALAQPVESFRRQAVAGEFVQEQPERVGGERIVLVQHVAVSEVVGVLGGVARRQRGRQRG